METQSIGKPSSPHADYSSNPQCTQSFAGDAQTQPIVDPCESLYALISATDTQVEKWSQSDTDPCNPPWSRIEYLWLLQAPPCECWES